MRKLTKKEMEEWLKEAIHVNVGPVKGEDGHSPIIEIINGYLYIDGKNTGVRVEGDRLKVIDDYLYINDENTNIKVKGEDGRTHTIGDNHNWFLDNIDTGKPSRGEDGKSVVIKGHYNTLEELKKDHPTGKDGEAWSIGKLDESYIYVWSTDKKDWENIGRLQGDPGKNGFSPVISEDFYWINEIGKTNVKAIGMDGKTYEIGENENWFLDGVDTGKPSRGKPGESIKGDDGKTYEIGENENWFLDGVDTGKPSRGRKGEDGKDAEGLRSRYHYSEEDFKKIPYKSLESETLHIIGSQKENTKKPERFLVEKKITDLHKDANIILNDQKGKGFYSFLWNFPYEKYTLDELLRISFFFLPHQNPSASEKDWCSHILTEYNVTPTQKKYLFILYAPHNGNPDINRPDYTMTRIFNHTTFGWQIDMNIAGRWGSSNPREPTMTYVPPALNYSPSPKTFCAVEDWITDTRNVYVNPKHTPGETDRLGDTTWLVNYLFPNRNTLQNGYGIGYILSGQPEGLSITHRSDRSTSIEWSLRSSESRRSLIEYSTSNISDGMALNMIKYKHNGTQHPIIDINENMPVNKKDFKRADFSKCTTPADRVKMQLTQYPWIYWSGNDNILKYRSVLAFNDNYLHNKEEFDENMNLKINAAGWEDEPYDPNRPYEVDWNQKFYYKPLKLK